MSQQHDDLPAERPDKDAAAHQDADFETSVADFLKRHPDFFVDHPDVLSGMTAPDRWSGDGVVDMQRFLLDRRLEEMDDLRNCAQEVIETSRSNMSTQTRTHAAVLALLGATDLDHLVRLIADDWPFLLDVDVVVFGYEPARARQPRLVSAHIRQFPAGATDAVLGPDQDVRLIRDMQDDGSIFGSGAGLVRSAALARLRPSGSLPPGLMALGSRGNAFHPGQGTELIGFLARILETCIDRALKAGP